MGASPIIFSDPRGLQPVLNNRRPNKDEPSAYIQVNEFLVKAKEVCKGHDNNVGGDAAAVAQSGSQEALLAEVQEPQKNTAVTPSATGAAADSDSQSDIAE